MAGVGVGGGQGGVAGQAQAFVDDGEGAQAEKVNFDQAGGFQAVFVPLDDAAAGHGGRFDGQTPAERRAH